jgi:phosphotransferase system  glucose/maltose/N-acetylglucosamine-specific IIC component
VNWDIFDFAVFGAMLLGVGVVYALAKRRASNTTYRFAIGVALAAAFLLVWVNGAVGIIGNENNDANMMFFGVLLVGVVGAIIARLRPKGMARAMYATAFASR